MIPKVEIITLGSGAGDTTIFAVPVGKVIEVHEINVDNLDLISHKYTAKLNRSITILNLRDQVTVGIGKNSTLTLANKKVIAMGNDFIKVNQNEVIDTFQSTVSLHYTEWDVGEIPGVEPKSVVGSINSSSFVNILSTSSSGPQRLVIRDFLAHVGAAAIENVGVQGQLRRSSINNMVENLSIPNNLVGTDTTQRWVLEQEGASVMKWRVRRTNSIEDVKFILSYIEHFNL